MHYVKRDYVTRIDLYTSLDGTCARTGVPQSEKKTLWVTSLLNNQEDMSSVMYIKLRTLIHYSKSFHTTPYFCDRSQDMYLKS
jgi:hypothetical protein